MRAPTHTEPPPPPPRQALPSKIREVSGSFSLGSPSNPSELTGEGDKVCMPPGSRVEALIPLHKYRSPLNPAVKVPTLGGTSQTPGLLCVGRTHPVSIWQHSLGRKD